MGKTKLDPRLKDIFNDLRNNAYDVNWHSYNYKYANQIIRKHFEQLVSEGEKPTQSDDACSLAGVISRFLHEEAKKMDMQVNEIVVGVAPIDDKYVYLEIFDSCWNDLARYKTLNGL